MAAIPGLVDLDSTLKPDKPTVAVDVKRDAASRPGPERGQHHQHAARPGGRPDGGQLARRRRPDLRREGAPGTRPARDNPDDLANLGLVLGQQCRRQPARVRLSQVADVRAGTGPNQINRRDLNREINIDANPLGRSTGEVSADIRPILDAIALAAGLPLPLRRQHQEHAGVSFGYAISALALAVVFIYMILASQFKSFLQPLALMSSLPLTLIGVVLALLLFGSAR
jgi:HAE1 family hydrophobic/amphiphilic exporter-1